MTYGPNISPLLSLLLLLLCFPLVGGAQATPQGAAAGQPCSAQELSFDRAEAERAFAVAAAKHRVQFGDLINSRGFHSPARDARDLSELKASLTGLKKGTAVLFYDLGANDFRIWLIDRDGIRAYSRTLLSRARLEMAVTELRESLNVENLAAARLPPRLRPAKHAPPSVNPKALLARRLSALTSLLLPNGIACALSAVSHLIVVPVLDLGTVPFAALRPLDGLSSLIDQASVTIAPSLFDIGRMKEDWSGDLRQALLVGNPYLAPSAGWESLDNAEREARAVGQMFKTTPLVGRKATKAAILKRVGEADLLYFATHGAADTAQPLDKGFLVFSGPNGRERLWTAHEIQRTPLRARLAVLSACQTGLGQTHDAGVIGLARAFQLAGVPRVVMSLWSVYDDATSELMQSFARHLRAHAPAEALRQAMLEVRRRRPDPAEWASFVIFGTPQ